MPPLDFFSMTAVVAVNLLAIAVALPWSMGHQVDAPARHAQRFFMLQGLAWILILAASRFPVRPWIDILPFLAASTAVWALWQLSRALVEWLGPRAPLLERGLMLLCIAGPLGFVVLVNHMNYRLAWFSLCHGLCVALMGCMALHPKKRVARGWRYLMFGIGMLMATSLAMRSVLALQTPWLPFFTAESPANHGFALVAPFCSTLLLIAILVAWRDEANQKLRDMALQDALTGLANRRCLENQGRLMLRRAIRERLPLSLVMLDLDYFKGVNDRYGHAVGDQALQLLARTLQKHTRGDEIAARWGGEEFCLLVHAGPDEVQALCMRLKSTLVLGSRLELDFELYFSAGCAHAECVWEGLTLEQMLLQADKALYQAKHLGRGRWETVSMQLSA